MFWVVSLSCHLLLPFFFCFVDYWHSYCSNSFELLASWLARETDLKILTNIKIKINCFSYFCFEFVSISILNSVRQLIQKLPDCWWKGVCLSIGLADVLLAHLTDCFTVPWNLTSDCLTTYFQVILTNYAHVR